MRREGEHSDLLRGLKEPREELGRVLAQLEASRAGQQEFRCHRPGTERFTGDGHRQGGTPAARSTTPGSFHKSHSLGEEEGEEKDSLQNGSA